MVTAQGLTILFRDHVWKLHSLPETTLSDREPQFAADFMKELNDILGSKLNYQWPTTLRQMAKQNDSTRRSNNIYGYLSAIVKTIGQN